MKWHLNSFLVGGLFGFSISFLWFLDAISKTEIIK